MSQLQSDLSPAEKIQAGKAVHTGRALNWYLLDQNITPGSTTYYPGDLGQGNHPEPQLLYKMGIKTLPTHITIVTIKCNH